MFWEILWMILMIFWLVGGGFATYVPNGPFPFRPYVGYTLIPWVCVLILGMFVFGVFGAPSPNAWK